MEIFRKTGQPDQMRWEKAGLRWLADSGPTACQVVRIVTHGDTWIEEPRLPVIGATPQAARDFGRGLAYTHAAGADTWGARPPGTEGDGWIGQARLPFPATPPRTWSAFYSTYRIRPYLVGPFTPDERRVILDLCDLLESGALEHPQPLLMSGPARIHGDLWSGNVMWTARGAILIDPAAQGGHAEDDLAALALFGAPHFKQIVEGYQSVSELAPGWETRLELHQMHLLMVHCFLFGRSYVGQTVEVAARCRRAAP